MRIIHEHNKEKLKKEYVYELYKTLYGLKVSSKRQNERFREAMIKLALKYVHIKPVYLYGRKTKDL